jgi:hypothetical protein
MPLSLGSVSICLPDEQRHTKIHPEGHVIYIPVKGIEQDPIGFNMKLSGKLFLKSSQKPPRWDMIPS